MTIDAIIMMVITLVGYIGGFSYFMIRGWIVAASVAFRRDGRRGKSGLHRAGRWVTPRGSDPRRAPQKANRRLRAVRVKRWGKSPPVGTVT